ncbi:hypothetical protein Ct61P_04069 [Colletotrichum tofieldiae]|nr:hypothetical protein Ct61P_04069 [Colletotrichum tofieldiae]
MGSASYIDLFASQLPVSAPQPSQHMQSRQKPVDPTDTAKLTIHPDHEATGPFGNETRMCLENEANEDWTYMTSTGDMKALPKLASCGSWGVSLPSKMNATIHIDPYIDRLNGLLHVEIESTKSPPSINVKLSRSQLAEQAKHSYLLEEHTAMRWKAWAVLASWVDHLVLRGAPPAIPPIDVVSFVRNRLLAEGRHAKTNAISLLQERRGVTLLPEGHHTSQMPRLTPASILPKPESSRAEASRAQLHGLLPATKPPLVSAAGKKRPLYGGSSSSSSSSSSSDSSPEIQAKRLRRAA